MCEALEKIFLCDVFWFEYDVFSVVEAPVVCDNAVFVFEFVVEGRTGVWCEYGESCAIEVEVIDFFFCCVEYGGGVLIEPEHEVS